MGLAQSGAEPPAPEAVRPAHAAFGKGAYAAWGMALALVVLGAGPAAAVEHTVLRWKKTGQCEIVTTVPLWGDHWVVLGDYASRNQAEQALSKFRRTRACPAGKSAKRMEKPPEQRKPAVTHRTERPIDMLW